MRVSRQFLQRCFFLFACPAWHAQRRARDLKMPPSEVYGIDPALHLQTKRPLAPIKLHAEVFMNFAISPRLSSIVGSRLAEMLNVEVGRIHATTFFARPGEYRRFGVAAIATSGVGTIRPHRLYCHLAVVKRFCTTLRSLLIFTSSASRIARPALGPAFEKTFFSMTAASWQEARGQSTLHPLFSP